jgi:uncharacterized protein YaiI (UPF0178 family)
MQTDPHVYVDADACPVKPEAVKVAERHGLPVTFVANAWLQLLGPAGKPFTADNIGNALATRELMSDLRAYGVGGGPPRFGPRDRSRFLEALELAVREAKRQRAGSLAASVSPSSMAS